MLQSCVAYKNVPSTVSEASQSYNRKIRISTINGDRHTLNWLETKNGYVVSILKTDKIPILISDIKQIKTLAKSNSDISLDSALNHPGIVEVFTKNDANQGSGEFIKLERFEDKIIGLEITGRDTTTLLIALEDICLLELENRSVSAAQTLTLGLAIAVTSIIAGTGISFAINGIDLTP